MGRLPKWRLTVSVKAIAWAFEQDLPTTLKFVLVALADHANDEGMCWPGQGYVAAKTGLKRPTVNSSIAKLVALGKMEATRRFDELGRPRSSVYRLCLKEGGNVRNDDSVCQPEASGYVSDDDKESSLRIIKGTEDPAPRNSESVSPHELVEGWNDTCGPLGLPTVRELSADRLTKVRARLKEHPKIFFWNDVLAGIEKSTFLRGLSGRNGDHKGWKASFDWLIENPTNCLKIAEGQYNG